MNWDKAKNIVITLLVIINAFLFYLNYLNSSKYILAAAQEKAISEIMSNNNIELVTKLPKNNRPLRQLSLKSDAFEIGVPASSFFDNAESVIRTVEFDKTIFRQGSKTLTFQNNSMIFEDFDKNIQDASFTEKKALIICENFIKGLSMKFHRLVIDEIKSEDHNYEIKYLEKYDNQLMFSNSITIKASIGGVFYAKLEKYNIEGYTGVDRFIYSADEVLLSLMPVLIDESVIETVYISKVDMGYDLNATENAAQNILNAVPYYRVFVNGRQLPYLINAFTNELK